MRADGHKVEEIWKEIWLPRTKGSVRILARLSGWSQERSSGRKRRKMIVPNHGAHFCALPLRTERRRPRLVWSTLITYSLEKPTAGWLCVRRRYGVRVHSVRISRVQLALSESPERTAAAAAADAAAAISFQGRPEAAGRSCLPSDDQGKVLSPLMLYNPRAQQSSSSQSIIINTILSIFQPHFPNGNGVYGHHWWRD